MMELMPVTCWNTGHSSTHASSGRYLRRQIAPRPAASAAAVAATAILMSAYSSLTSTPAPRTFCSTARAASGWPRDVSDAGVSGKKAEPTSSTRAGTPAPARE